MVAGNSFLLAIVLTHHFFFFFLLAVGLDQPQLLVSEPSHRGCLLPKSQEGSEFSRTIGVYNVVTEAISYLSCIPLFRQVTDHSHTLGIGCGYQVVGFRELCNGLSNVTYCLLSLFHLEQLRGPESWTLCLLLPAFSAFGRRLFLLYCTLNILTSLGVLMIGAWASCMLSTYCAPWASLIPQVSFSVLKLKV